MLDKLRSITQELMSKNDNNFNKYSLINDILKEDNCFKEMDMDTAISILKDLGYSHDDSIKIYTYFLINI